MGALRTPQHPYGLAQSLHWNVFALYSVIRRLSDVGWLDDVTPPREEGQRGRDRVVYSLSAEGAAALARWEGLGG